MADAYDVIVIGGGPGGYHAAIRAAQLGKKPRSSRPTSPAGAASTTPASRRRRCCTRPRSSTTPATAAELGVTVEGAALDWEALAERRAKVSEGLSGGVKMLWDKNKVTLIEGRGALDSDANVVVDGTTYEAGAVILATGSVALTIPGVEFSERVVDTWGAWSLPDLPKSIAVVGAGASGAEIASAYVRLRHRGHPDRDARPDPPRRGQGRRPGGRAGIQEAGDQGAHRQPGLRRRGGLEVGQGQGRRRVDRGRVPGDRRRPRAGHRRLGPRRGGGEDGRRRQGRDRRLPADLEPEGVRDRRPRPRPGAGPQGSGGGRGRGRDDRRRAHPSARPEPGRRAPPSVTRRWRASG